VNSNVKVERSGQQTAADKEFALFSAFPRPLLRLSVLAANTLDYFNLLPAFFIEGDAMYTSLFVANLGSLHMGAGYHHLYEWGTCPLFLMVGQVEERPVVRDGKVVVGKVLPLRYSYDERIDDGLNARFGIEAAKRVLENPEMELGCIAEDGSDVHPLGAAPEPEAAE
ncbi:MAG: 2-oxo acid dehydrogenase subunit E2, partial [Deltaproteobacteria bacterium]|nr:2-oxo acid dehydrogenase subunit E2 [Deltaproteobacteria bacterium]